MGVGNNHRKIYKRYSDIVQFFKSNRIDAQGIWHDSSNNAIYMMFDNLKDANGYNALHLELHEHYDEPNLKVNDDDADILKYSDSTIRLGIHFHDQFLKKLDSGKMLETNAFVKTDPKLSFQGPSNTIFDTLSCCGCPEHPIWYDHGISCTFEDLLSEVFDIKSGKLQLTNSKIAMPLMQEMFALRKIALGLLARLA